MFTPLCLGYYYNTQNSDSFIYLTNTGDYPITVMYVYSYSDKKEFCGSGENVGISGVQFGANFNRVREVKDGKIDYNTWYQNAVLIGSYNSLTSTISLPSGGSFIKK